jgi:hypothetical protein
VGEQTLPDRAAVQGPVARTRRLCVLRPVMAAAYSSEPWHELFVGVAGTAAALTGLLFVSLSITTCSTSWARSGCPAVRR